MLGRLLRSAAAAASRAPRRHRVKAVWASGAAVAAAAASAGSGGAEGALALALTEEQRRSYEENGFLVLEGVVPPEQLEAMQRRAAAVVDDFVSSSDAETRSVFSTKEQNRTSDDYFLGSGDKVRCFFEEGAFDEKGALVADPQRSINKIGHALHEKHAEFRSFANGPLVHDVVFGLGYEDPRLLQGMYIFKQPRIGGEVGTHQDSTFLYTQPLSAMGLWLAVEDATLENGCLWAVPGSHAKPPTRRFVRNLDAPGTRFEPAEDLEPLSTEGAVPLPVPRGSLVLIHGSLVHFSHANRSDRSRHAFTVHVIDGKCEYPADNWLQRQDGQEIMRLDGRC